MGPSWETEHQSPVSRSLDYEKEVENMLLRELIQDVPYVIETRGSLDTDIREITSSSREHTD